MGSYRVVKRAVQLFDIVVKVKLVKFSMLVLPRSSLLTTQLLFDFIYYRFVIFFFFAICLLAPPRDGDDEEEEEEEEGDGGLSTLEADGVSSFGNKY